MMLAGPGLGDRIGSLRDRGLHLASVDCGIRLQADQQECTMRRREIQRDGNHLRRAQARRGHEREVGQQTAGRRAERVDAIEKPEPRT